MATSDEVSRDRKDLTNVRGNLQRVKLHLLLKMWRSNKREIVEEVHTPLPWSGD